MMDFVITWANNNSGFVGILIFVCTLFIGWVSGIFRTLRRRPIFKLRTIPGPTQCSIISTNKKNGNYDIHRTAISIYLGISNIGSAASTIKNVQIGFHWHLTPFSWLWLKNTVFYFWVENPTIIMEDFQYSFDGNTKVFPFLLQGSNLTRNNIDTYLEVGREINGVVYFELDDGFGGRFPSPTKGGSTRIKVSVEDVFGKKHKKTFKVPLVAIEEARKYNPSFGGTYATIRQDSD